MFSTGHLKLSMKTEMALLQLIGFNTAGENEDSQKACCLLFFGPYCAIRAREDRIKADNFRILH